MSGAVVVWAEPTGSIVPKTANSAPAIADVARTLSTRDKTQIVNAFQFEAYEMMAGFVLNKALSQLKQQLAALGMEFVGEMLGRPDLDDDSIPTVSISDYEALRLAKELGIINSTDAVRMTQHLELLAHFDSLSNEEAEHAEMSQQEAISFLRTCVNAVLGREGDFAPLEFVQFRQALESRTFKATDAEMLTLSGAPYFFRKTTVSILLSGVKSKAGAQYEHTLGNILVIIPALWGGLRDAERWNIGQAYAEVVNSGLGSAVVALKKALTAVRGFDFVPETLRSQTFAAAAADIIRVHTAMNNYYNEPPAMAALAKLGTTIPWPAFPISMSATISVYLGNAYGFAWGAQGDVDLLLSRLTSNQWDYYLNECLSQDGLVLQKLAWSGAPRERWLDLVQKYALAGRQTKRAEVGRLLAASDARDLMKLKSIAEKLLAAAAN